MDLLRRGGGCQGPGLRIPHHCERARPSPACAQKNLLKEVLQNNQLSTNVSWPVSPKPSMLRAAPITLRASTIALNSGTRTLNSGTRRCETFPALIHQSLKISRALGAGNVKSLAVTLHKLTFQEPVAFQHTLNAAENEGECVLPLNCSCPTSHGGC